MDKLILDEEGPLSEFWNPVSGRVELNDRARYWDAVYTKLMNCPEYGMQEKP